MAHASRVPHCRGCVATNPKRAISRVHSYKRHSCPHSKYAFFVICQHAHNVMCETHFAISRLAVCAHGGRQQVTTRLERRFATDAPPPHSHHQSPPTSPAANSGSTQQRTAHQTAPTQLATKRTLAPRLCHGPCPTPNCAFDYILQCLAAAFSDVRVLAYSPRVEARDRPLPRPRPLGPCLPVVQDPVTLIALTVGPRHLDR